MVSVSDIHYFMDMIQLHYNVVICAATTMQVLQLPSFITQ